MDEKCLTPPDEQLNGEQLNVVARLLEEGAHAVTVKGDLKTGRERYDMAYHLAKRAGDAQAVALAALGLGGLWVHEHRTAAASVRLQSRLRHALSLLHSGSPLAIRVRARLTAETDYAGSEHSGIIGLLREARSSGDPVVRAEVVNLAHHCLLGPDYATLRHELATELIEQSFGTERRSDLLMGILWQAVNFMLVGNPHAERRLSELRELLARRANLAVGFVVSAIEVTYAIRTGHLDKAEELSRLSLQRGVEAGGVDAPNWHAIQLVAIRWYQNRLAELLPELDELVRSPTLSAVDSSFRAALAFAAALSGQHQKASSVLASLCNNDLSKLPRSSSWLVAMKWIAETAFLLKDRKTAEQVYELLGPYKDQPIIGGMGIVCFGSVQHTLGVAAMTTGAADMAVLHFRAAIQQNLALAHWPAILVSRERLVEALTLRGQPQDIAEAESELTMTMLDPPLPDLPMPRTDRRKSAETKVVLARHGRTWRIQVGARFATVDHRVGMFHLAVLIANPRQEIPAIELVAGLSAVRGTARQAPSSAQAVLDREALEAYRRRVKVLHAEISDLESRQEAKGTTRIRAERDWLEQELSRSTKLGSESRLFDDDGERARIAVGKAIRRAVVHITNVDRLIGDHLSRTIHTGLRCSYWPI